MEEKNNNFNSWVQTTNSFIRKESDYEKRINKSIDKTLKIADTP